MSTIAAKKKHAPKSTPAVAPVQCADPISDILRANAEELVTLLGELSSAFGPDDGQECWLMMRALQNANHSAQLLRVCQKHGVQAVSP